MLGLELVVSTFIFLSLEIEIWCEGYATPSGSEYAEGSTPHPRGVCMSIERRELREEAFA